MERKILVCKNHPLKPANKICWECKVGLCKYCGIYDGTQYWYCEDCRPEKKTRGVIHF